MFLKREIFALPRSLRICTLIRAFYALHFVSWHSMKYPHISLYVLIHFMNWSVKIILCTLCCISIGTTNIWLVIIQIESHAWYPIICTFFVSSPLKSVTNYGVAWMGHNLKLTISMIIMISSQKIHRCVYTNMQHSVHSYVP